MTSADMFNAGFGYAMLKCALDARTVASAASKRGVSDHQLRFIIKHQSSLRKAIKDSGKIYSAIDMQHQLSAGDKSGALKKWHKAWLEARMRGGGGRLGLDPSRFTEA